MCNPHNDYNDFIILDLVEDAIFSLMDAVFIVSCEFFTSPGTGIMRKTPNSIHNPVSILFGYLFQFLDR